MFELGSHFDFDAAKNLNIIYHIHYSFQLKILNGRYYALKYPFSFKLVVPL